MNVLAINGSPRKTWNTATMLQHTLDGAQLEGAGIELVHLYDLDFKGCISCFACKLKGGKIYGKCALRDGLTPVLKKKDAVDALIFGSLIYFGEVTGEMRCFMERLLFPSLTYTRPPASLLLKKIPTALVYSINVSEQMMKENYGALIDANEQLLARMLGHTESLFANETLHFEDYDNVVFSYFNPEERKERWKTVFPQDCRRAFALGVSSCSMESRTLSPSNPQGIPVS